MLPSIENSEWFEDPMDIIAIPNNAPIIVKKILKLIVSFKNILLIMAANTGEVLKINNALATEVISMAAIKNIEPNPWQIINIIPFIPGFFIKSLACFK